MLRARGDPSQITERTDVYGLGALLYDLLANQTPFAGAQVAEVRERVLRADPVPPSRIRPDVDRHLEAVCLKCLEKDPARRYGSAQEVTDELAQWLNDGTTRVRPSGPVAKAGRWMRRHPATMAVAVVVLLVAVATPIVLKAIDSDRAMKDVLQRLEDDESVVLVDDNGRPQVRPKVIVGSAVIVAPDDTPVAARPLAKARPPVPNVPLVIEGTNDPALVQLLPGVPTVPYRLTAELSQYSSSTPLAAQFRERVGIYFGDSLVNSPTPGLHGFYVITFGEIRPQGVKQGVPKVGPASAEFKFDMAMDGVGGATADAPIHTHSFPSAPMTFRRIEVEVHSDRIDWFVNGVRAGTHNSVDIRGKIESIELAGIDARTLVPNPRGGCGLYVKSATLHVRNVTLEPIP